MTIETENMRLVECDREILLGAIAGDEHLAKKLGVTVADNWTEFGVGPFQYSLDCLAENEYNKGWLTYFPIHRKDNKLIGSCGYKGKPTEDGIVEIGYELAPDYRNKGLGLEMAKGLIENAFKYPNIKAIIAHTLQQDNPSTKILTKHGFKKVADIYDPDDGEIWKWELKRQ